MGGALIAAGVGLLTLGIYLFIVGVSNGKAETALIKMPGPLSRRTRWTLSTSGIFLMAAGIIIPFNSTSFENADSGDSTTASSKSSARTPTQSPKSSPAITVTSPQSVSNPPTSQDVAEAAPTYLNSLTPVGGDNSFDEKGALDIDGKNYPYAMSFATSDPDGAPEKVEYDLGTRYRKFSAVLGLRDDAPETDGGPSACHWQILVDNRELISADTSRGNHFKIDAKDVTGVVHLTIIATQTKGRANPVPWPCTMGDGQVK